MIVELNETTWVESQNVTSMKLYPPATKENRTQIWVLEISLIDRDVKLVEFASEDEAVDAARNMGTRRMFTRTQLHAYARQIMRPEGE